MVIVKLCDVLGLFSKPFFELVQLARNVHVENFGNDSSIQKSVLYSIKTGTCPENCRYCAQSAHYNTGIEKEKLKSVEDLKPAIKHAKEIGATRLCISAAWRNLHNRNIDTVIEMVREIKKNDLEACATLGMLTYEQACKLKESGLDFYNHNVDTSRDHYHTIVTTRNYDDRLETIQNVGDAGLRVCAGGIIGMGESVQDRANMLATLANMKHIPESIPINRLVPISGTPLAEQEKIDDVDFIKTIAVTRIVFPRSYVRLSAGRREMNQMMQAWCFFVGANSIFCGDKLLTVKNNDYNSDTEMLESFQIKDMVI